MNYQEIKQQHSDLESRLSDPAVIKDVQKLTELNKQLAFLKPSVDLINRLETAEKQLADNQTLLQDITETELAELIKNEQADLQTAIKELTAKLEAELRPKNTLDKKSAIMEIRAGTGGDESALFAAELYRMYHHFAEKHNFKVEIINSNQIGLGGFKEIIFQVHGQGAYGLLKYEAGTHRVQRVPETEKSGRVHTSVVTVAVLPEAEEFDLEIKPQDIRIDTFCSSGPGGQSVNTTYSAVRLTYLPTGLIVTCQDQKSQHQNKEKALQVLRSRLLQQAEEERKNKETKERKEMIGTGDRSEKIRTYNFPQDRVTDHRLQKNWHNISNIMAGEIMPLIEALQKAIN